MSWRFLRGNVLILSCSMALGLSGAPVIVLLGGIVGVELAPRATLSTLPVAMLVTGLAFCTVPAAFVMKAAGRRRGFMAASLVAAAASLLGVLAIAEGSFLLFCIVAFMIGANMAFVQQYRFAAAESVDFPDVGKAVSAVLLGGIAAAFLGPELASRARDVLPFGHYSGSFAGLFFLYAANTLLLGFLKEPPSSGEETGEEERPIGSVVRQPLYLTALLASLTAFGVMSLVMTATPVSMHVIDSFSIIETSRVIQSHVMAMYIPSLFTGALISRLGLARVMSAGIILMAACAAFALAGRHFIHYWAGLVLLGAGWNFLFIGGTTLLTRTYRSGEKFKAQALNDFVVFGFQALASLSAGTLIFRAGWEKLNVISLPLLFIVLCIVVKQRSAIEGK